MRRSAHPTAIRRSGWVAALTALALGVLSLVAVAAPAQADVPPTPVASAFDAPLCDNTTGNPSVDADGGPVTNLLSVFGQRLTDYNAGGAVALYNNNGRSGWTSGGSQYAANPVCMVRYDAETAGPVSGWAYCTYDRASVCVWTNAAGQIERLASTPSVLAPLADVAADTRLTADQQALQAYIAQTDMLVLAGVNGSGGTIATDTIANNDSPTQRTLRQNLIHCIDNPNRYAVGNAQRAFCDNNMSAAIQARILEIVGASPADTLSADGPASVVLPGDSGQIDVVSSLAGIPIELAVTGGTVTLCAGEATLTGTTLLINEDAVLPAEITLCATRPDDGDVDVAFSAEPPVGASLDFVKTYPVGNPGSTLCQIFTGALAADPVVLSASAVVTFAEDILVPSIGTSLVDQLDGDKNVAQMGGVVIDTVTYTGVTPGTEYVLTGELMDQSTGDATGILGETNFTPVAESGSVTVEFIIEGGWAGQTLVAFETLSESAGPVVASHEDIDDEAQTVYLADIGTTLLDEADDDSTLPYTGGTAIDTVEYVNLKPGETYTISGELKDQSDDSSTGIFGETEFTPVASSGTVEVEFEIGPGYAGRSLVAFEVLTDSGDVVIAVHEDINDEAQTVFIEDAPSIGTTLVDDVDGDHHVVQSGGTVIDTVAYEGLIDGETYTVTGELYDQTTGNPTGIVGETEFVSDGTGTVEVEFTISDEWAGRTLVAFESLLLDDTEVASHEDIEDAAQTVWIADIGTSLVDEADGNRILPAAGGTVIDTVAYTNLVPSTEYTVSGELMVQATGTGTGIVGSTTFTSSATGTGTVDVEFTIPAGYDGDSLVAFEVLTYFDGEGDLVVAVHEDIGDAAQTVTITDAPAIGTTLVDDLDGDQYVIQGGGTVIDTVSYENLIPNTEYTVSGELMDTETGDPTGILGEETFTSSATGDGTVEVSFVISDAWAGRILTAFEFLALGGDEVASHEDIDDLAQTVWVADIGTFLADVSGLSKSLPFTGGTVIDTVSYENLAPNTAYTLSGELYDKATGEPTGIVGEADFVSSATGDGEAEVEFVIPSGWAGASLVAFEVLTQDDTVIATHEDIDDEAQTVTVRTATATSPTGPALASTGAGVPLAPLVLAALLALAGGALMLVRRRLES